MKGLIVYDKESLDKNRFFAAKLQNELIALGVDVDVVLKKDAFKLHPDFAIMRVYDEKLSSYFDSSGLRTFNNREVAHVCNDKWETYLRLKDIVPVAYTQKAEDCNIPFPCIVKARHGHGGSEVFWADDEIKFKSIVDGLKDCAIVQPPVGKRGRDLRVYVVGGEPIVAMLRKSDVDFRSNFSLGGSAEIFKLGDDAMRLIKKICSVMDFDFVGVDFLLGEDGLICNEIEDVVGCRMVYEYTDIDIIKIYAEYIVCSLKGAKMLVNI